MICFILTSQFTNAQIDVTWETKIAEGPGLRYYLPPPDNYRDIATVDIIVDYVDVEGIDSLGNPIIYSWPEEVIAAFEYAVSIWESVLVSEVPIKIIAKYYPDVPFLAGGLGKYSLSNDYNSEELIENTIYSTALLNSIINYDSYPDQADIFLNIDSDDIDWYFGTDGNCPIDKYDFVQVVLHEIGHGLGFHSSFLRYYDYDPHLRLGRTWSDGNSYPFIFDYSIGKDGEFITDFELPLDSIETQQLFDFVYSGASLKWDGIYTPTAHIFNNGDSFAFSHLTDSYYNPHDTQDSLYTINSLMVSNIYSGQSNHNPGPLTIGILKDMGWEVDYNSSPTMLEFNLIYNGPAGSPCSSVILDFEANLSNEYKISYFRIGSKDDTVQITVGNDIFDIQIDDLKVDESYAFWFDAVNEYASVTSPVIVRGACKSPIVVYPNPTAESVLVAYEDDEKVIGNVEVRKTDNPNIGKTKQGDGTSNEISVNIDDLPVGTYTIIVTNIDGSTSTKTIVIY